MTRPSLVSLHDDDLISEEDVGGKPPSHFCVAGNRFDSIELQIKEIVSNQVRLQASIGTMGDPVTETPPSGMIRILTNIGNDVNKLHHKLSAIEEEWGQKHEGLVEEIQEVRSFIETKKLDSYRVKEARRNEVEAENKQLREKLERIKEEEAQRTRAIAIAALKYAAAIAVGAGTMKLDVLLALFQ